MKLQTALKGSLVAVVMLVASGCASTKINELSARVDRVAQDAAAAKSAADAANAAASEARQIASGAQSTANQALNAANQAQACCDATNEKIDRMFQRSQAK
jgi:methyl-accepting chemotaxis protein